jgi:hypothetical protein
MGDPYNGFEGRIRIVDLIHKRILYHRGQRGVKSGCRFLQIPELDIYKNLRWGRKRVAMVKKKRNAPSSIKTSARLKPYAIASDIR